MRPGVSPAHPSTTPARGTYRVDPTRTTVRFRTRHMFGLGRASGTVRLRDAEIVVGESMADTRVRAVLDAGSFDTGNPSRDQAVHSPTYLDSATYPDLEFAADTVRYENRAWVAQGTLTAHGVSAPLAVTVVGFDEDGRELSVRATAAVDRYAHGVTAGKGLAGRRLTLDISAVAVR